MCVDAVRWGSYYYTRHTCVHHVLTRVHHILTSTGR